MEDKSLEMAETLKSILFWQKRCALVRISRSSPARSRSSRVTQK